MKIWDDGTNYKVDLINTATGNSVLPNIASIAKTSVRPFNLGRAVEVSEPFTNYYALDANLDNWIVRKYAASEPTITLGPATPTAVTISSFIGIAHLSSVQLDWEMANDVELVGFNLTTVPRRWNGAKHKLNAVLIPALNPTHCWGRVTSSSMWSNRASATTTGWNWSNTTGTELLEPVAVDMDYLIRLPLMILAKQPVFA